jgi:Ni/Co efflux regulator RcnB
MHSKPIICAIAALSMSFSGLTFAQQDKEMRGEGAQRELNQNLRQQQRVPQQQRQVPDRARGGDDRGRFEGRRADDHRRFEERRFEERRFEERRFDDHRRFDDRRVYESREWRHRGGRLPSEYRSRSYVVDDWRGHRLSAPPRGYYWVQDGSDYLLVAITTGIIASILLNH